MTTINNQIPLERNISVPISTGVKCPICVSSNIFMDEILKGSYKYFQLKCNKCKIVGNTIPCCMWKNLRKQSFMDIIDGIDTF